MFFFLFFLPSLRDGERCSPWHTPTLRRKLYIVVVFLFFFHLLFTSLRRTQGSQLDSLSNALRRRRGINWRPLVKGFRWTICLLRLCCAASGKNGRFGFCLLFCFNWRDHSNMTTKIEEKWQRQQRKKNGGQYFVIKEFHGRMREGGSVSWVAFAGGSEPWRNKKNKARRYFSL